MYISIICAGSGRYFLGKNSLKWWYCHTRNWKIRKLHTKNLSFTLEHLATTPSEKSTTEINNDTAQNWGAKKQKLSTNVYVKCYYYPTTYGLLIDQPFIRIIMTFFFYCKLFQLNAWQICVIFWMRHILNCIYAKWQFPGTIIIKMDNKTLTITKPQLQL